MNEFLRKVFSGNKETPSVICLQSFNQNFKEAKNVEWFKKENRFEALFYLNNLEHIALFSLNGILLEYRINISADYLPVHIKSMASSKGEIMNSVMRNKGNRLEYEIIVRDQELNRSFITVSEMGKIIEEKKL